MVYYRQALEVDDSNRDANLGLAEAYQGLGQDSYAESVYQDMLAEDDSQADVYELLAQLYIQQSKLDEARQLLDEASQKVEDEEITVLYQLTRPEPPTTSETSSRMPSSRRRVSTSASASSMGMPTLSRMRVGAAPVPPR